MLGSFHSCQAKDDGGLDKCDNEDEEKNKFLRSTQWVKSAGLCDKLYQGLIL